MRKNFLERFADLFTRERPSISLSLFRIFVAITIGCVVFPAFCHLGDNYLATGFKIRNESFFPIGFLDFIARSPDGLVIFFVYLFAAAWLFFLIGFYTQISGIIMTGCAYYFYALNYYQVGTLSWDILLVTVFLICLTPYPGDYFSVDCLRASETSAYKRLRPYFIQRLLQLQIGFIHLQLLHLSFHFWIILICNVILIPIQALKN